MLIRASDAWDTSTRLPGRSNAPRHNPAGCPPPAAIDFADNQSIEESPMETLLQDLRFALRSYRRAPAFPIAAIVTLALGIGATTAIFSTLNAVLLKPLPYPQPEDLYSVRTDLTDGRVTTGLVAGSEIFRLNDPNLSIERAAAHQGFDVTYLH